MQGKKPSSITHVRNAERLTDGVRATTGDVWDSDLVAIFDLGASIEWDLGSSQPIEAAYVQADHDDVYSLLISEDGHAWRTLWEATSLAADGQQPRMTRGLAGHGRYVRLEPREGDGAYSVSEFALFRSVQAALPPGLREERGESEARVTRSQLRLAMIFAALLAVTPLAFGFAGPRFSRRRFALEKGVLVVGALLLVSITAFAYRALYRDNTIDDAYISFQYAKNWASGQGLVFNPGERVEGFSNFLWVALLTPLWPLSGFHPDTFAFGAFLLALALAIAALLLVARVAHREFESLAPFVFALLLVAFDDAFVTYAVFSLEVHLVIVCTLAALSASLNRSRNSRLLLGACFALLAMTRLDGALLAISFFTVEALRLVRIPAERRGVEFMGLAHVALAFALPFGVYFALRYWYFGHPLPNTFYLKVGDSFAALPRGLEYAKSFLVERWYVPLLALLGVLAWNKQRWVPWVFLHVLLHVAYVIYVGGDFYSGQRFLLVLTPELALLTAAGVAACLSRWPQGLASQLWLPAAVGACLFVRWGTLGEGPATLEIRVWGDVVDNNVRYMRWMKGVARPSASLVLGDIGGAGFFADLKVLDVYGVVDAEVAHRKVEGFGTGKAGHEKKATLADFLPRKPTYIKLGFVDVPNHLPGYYLFNDFPPGLDVDGLFVRDDLASGRTLDETAFHMNPGELESWSRTGDSFTDAPSAAAPRGQGYVAFADGHFIDSFTAEKGDRATGRLVSPRFTLTGDRLRLLVGGGRDPVRLRVSLVVDECEIFSATGTNHETLGRREWDITRHRGKEATILIVDEATGPWGHLLVDEIAQWQGQPNTTGKL